MSVYLLILHLGVYSPQDTHAQLTPKLIWVAFTRGRENGLHGHNCKSHEIRLQAHVAS